MVIVSSLGEVYFEAIEKKIWYLILLDTGISWAREDNGECGLQKMPRILSNWLWYAKLLLGLPLVAYTCNRLRWLVPR